MNKVLSKALELAYNAGTAVIVGACTILGQELYTRKFSSRIWGDKEPQN